MQYILKDYNIKERDENKYHQYEKSSPESIEIFVQVKVNWTVESEKVNIKEEQMEKTKSTLIF